MKKVSVGDIGGRETIYKRRKTIKICLIKTLNYEKSKIRATVLCCFRGKEREVIRRRISNILPSPCLGTKRLCK